MGFSGNAERAACSAQNRGLEWEELWEAREAGAVVLPEGVTELGCQPFRRRRQLREIHLPDSLESIGPRAFEGCTGLVRVRIPPAVKKISSTAFLGCSALAEIAVDSGNPFFQSRQGALFSADGKTLLLCPNGKQGSFAVPQGVERIGPSAFRSCARLTELLLPDSLRKIGNRAFEGCIGLVSLTLPQGVKKLPRQALKNCTRLVDLFLPQSLAEIDFWGQALEGCPALEQITVAPGNPDFSTQDGVLFDGEKRTVFYCPPAKEGDYRVPDGVQGVGSWMGRNAFSGCARLTGLALPATMVLLSPFFFPFCSSLRQIRVDPQNPVYRAVEGVLLSKDGARLIRGSDAAVIPEGVEKLENYSFSGCAGLVSLQIPEGVTAVGRGAFQQCPRLSQVTLPASLERLDGSAFAGCGQLQRVFFRNGGTKVSQSAFAHCPKSLVLCAAAGSWIEERAKEWGLGFHAV